VVVAMIVIPSIKIMRFFSFKIRLPRIAALFLWHLTTAAAAIASSMPNSSATSTELRY
jgi:hypothetical protein